MEKRKEMLSTVKVCRFCLSAQESLIPLYDNKVRAPKNSVPFALKILACIAIEIFPSDNMPQFICQRCKLFMELSYAFKQLCRQADEAILQYVQHGLPLNAISWPSQLTKAYKSINKPEVNVVKTVVQGGATVKVLAEEISDSEEGEEDNVYNVKIGDGSEEGKSIKIITSIDQSGPKSRQGTSKNFEDADSSEVNVVPGCWPCDECECTYPLEQLLTLHKAQKHRVRNEICEECGGRFFSKNDLEVHQLTHTSETPFQCVACGKKFKRLILLKRHEKVMHSDLPQQSCPSCPATFLSNEELEAHQLKHERHPMRLFSCLICKKSFPNKNLLQRHTSMVHGKKSDFSCQYCPEQFASVSKLTRHVREHAGVRPYPCKHCDKSFTKSHHYTRHLRVKHAETIRIPGPYNEVETYRCDECEETFSNQDDLMYHSALHATRNLICPLCQEKFDDVDTVTAHIKSHVNGTEYMCDFCELIFTSKEKLEDHIARSHDDELLAMNDQETEHDESSMDMDAEEDDDNSINVKEENGEMVVEIKKANEYMLPAVQTEEDKADNNLSEDSDFNYTDFPVTEFEPTQIPKQNAVAKKNFITKVLETPPKETPVVTKPAHTTITQQPTNPPPILRKAEDVKRKAAVMQQQALASDKTLVADKKDKPPVKVEPSSVASGASEKSLRLLEKELQDLKRTNSRTEVAKTPAKNVEALRSRRPQLFSSTPKQRNADKKDTVTAKSTPEKEKSTIEKKQADRKVKDTKELKEIKSNNNSIKDDKEFKGFVKEEKEQKGNKEDKEHKGNKEDKESKGNKEDKEPKANKEDKEPKTNKEDKECKLNKEDKEPKGNSKEDKPIKEERRENAKTVVKNGASDTPTPVNDDAVRRSARPSKVKDYAKMIRDSSMESDDDTDIDDDEEDYKESEKTPETPRVRGRRASNKPTALAKVATSVVKQDTLATAPRKRGRPRKEPRPVVPSKIKKDDPSENADESTKGEATTPKENKPENVRDGTKTPEANKLPQESRPGVIISPSGQTLKKVPIKSLPPGVKPLPLPVNSRLGGGEVTEMQIGKKMVKVQKIVMTKAEVEAMTKQGLLEIKDGTMVLKQGIKLPSSDPTALKSTLVGEGDANKESPKPAPMRCDVNE